ncbi:LuxR C-terminal-related transcriptional regulator [Oleiharenicola sp. Vm1]|uniref:LuxR C-terminal-related transcriptional regulator n=1 Tax=Oleiharenicola sp. Vm1 TaxID=3398393 RepID=UPI0039F57A4D
MNGPRLSLLHVDDDPLWQGAVAAALRATPEVGKSEVVESARAARERAAVLRPNVVLLDLVLPDGDGLELARELSHSPAPPRIILLSVRRDDVVLLATSRAHIAGLLWKTDDVLTQLPAAIRAVAAGDKYLPREVYDAVRRFRADPQAYFKILSDRELELLPQIGAGLSDEQIASTVGLSAYTVKTHRIHLMGKLNVHSRTELIHWAIQRGFARPPNESWVAREDKGRESSDPLPPFG